MNKPACPTFYTQHDHMLIMSHVKRKICGVLEANLEILVISRVFKSESAEFLTQGFSIQKSVEICSIMEIPWNGKDAFSITKI
jgi:hypothetical protein